MTSLVALLVAVFLGVLGTAPRPTEASGPAEGEPDLVLLVSNQSFDDPSATLTFTIDGQTVVDQEFDVEGQHTWVEFPLDVGPGHHRLVAQSDQGHNWRQDFRLPDGERRWAAVEYWAGDDHLDRTFTWRMDDRPLAFD